MDIINPIFTDIFKNNIIQQNTNMPNILGNTNIPDTSRVSGIEKTAFEDLNNAVNIKSDAYLASRMPLDNADDLIAFAKKLLYNEKFREIAINSNPKLKEAYENFTEAIKVDDSKLAEYIKSVLSDPNKFSGEFFYALNKLMSDTKDLSLKNSIYDFLKIFDYYFSQDENASSVNSALNELLSRLPEDLRNYLLKLLSNSFDNRLNLLLLSILDTKLPDREKLKLLISYLLDFADNSSNIKDSDPLNILNSFPQTSTQSNDDIIRFIDIALKSLKSSGLELDDELKALVDSLEEKLSSQGTDISDKFMSEQSLNMQKSNINALNKLISNISAQNSNYANELKSSDIVKFLNILKESAGFDDKNIINSLIDDLTKLKLENSSELLAIFDKIKDNVLSNNSFSREIKDNLIKLFNKLADDTLENLIFSNVSKNKCEVLLNIYEKTIMPSLLKNTEQFNAELSAKRFSNLGVSKNIFSNLTHNLLRLKLGTADEFSKQIKTFFNQINYKKLVDSEESVDMKLALINRLTEQREMNGGMKEFLKLLDLGIKLSSNEQNKAAFENILLSMLSKDDLMARYKHFFLPLIYNGQNVLSEIFLDIDRIKDEDKKKELSIEDLVFKITMILDIDNKGVFNTTLVYSNGEISANISVPKNFSASSIKIYNDLKNIIAKNKLKARSIVVS